ncbi:MAG: 3-deoxy-manno-octulosonate cytidylyltransferase (CMP-KDO synthetase) [Verrucomicrobiales bacterium]|jgi:3-deoxy-manno-octulosonate cytidylyltransferase (CMP-KDO synthetase)
MAIKIYGFIPARWASTRFPGKPLHVLAGKPLIQHVWERCQRCSELDRVLVATDDDRIAEAARAFGAEVCMTRADHLTGSDRIAEAASNFEDCTHVINVQGDEPLIDPTLVDMLARRLRDEPDLPMVTAANVLTDESSIADPNIVKVVLNKQREALYFSRSVIPHGRSQLPGITWYRHQGIYGYSKAFLLEYVRWEPSPLELTEQLEQLRALENGATIAVVLTEDDAIGVDTPEQADQVARLLQSSSLPQSTS